MLRTAARRIAPAVSAARSVALSPAQRVFRTRRGVEPARAASSETSSFPGTHGPEMKVTVAGTRVANYALGSKLVSTSSASLTSSASPSSPEDARVAQMVNPNYRPWEAL